MNNNHPNRSTTLRYHYDARTGMIDVWAGQTETKTFRCGPTFNNRPAGVSIETNDVMMLIDHIARHDLRQFDREYRESIRLLVADARRGDAIDLPDSATEFPGRVIRGGAN